MTVKLHSYQQELKEKIYNEWARVSNVLAVLPTGGGKSVIVSDIILDGAKAGMQQCVIAHRNELVNQMSGHIARRGIPHRIIGSDSTIAMIRRQHRNEFGQVFVNPTARTAVIGVDTLVARRDDLAAWATQTNRWVTDESHHLLLKNKWGKAVQMFPHAQGLGVTATPCRADGQGLGREFDGVMDSMVLGPTMRQLIGWGNLCDYEIVCPESDIIISDDNITASGDYSPQKLAAAAEKSHIVGDVVENYIKYASGRRAIVFATDVKTAHKIAEKFNANNIAAAAVSAQTPVLVREKYLGEFRSGKLLVLVNVDLFDEGFDCLDTETEILTPNGWKNWEEMMYEKECYAWNPENNKAEIVAIKKHGVRLLRPNEKMLSIESQHTSIRVTENHRIFYKDVNYYKHGSSGFSPFTNVKTAEDIYNNPKNKFALPLCAEGSFNGLPLKDDEIRILAWYMTDGYLDKNNALEITQVKKHQIKNIRLILQRLEWEYSEKQRIMKNSYSGETLVHVFRIPKASLEHLLPYMIKKNPPSILHDMTREQFKIFWDSFMDGNGSKAENKSGEACTMFKRQADFITHAASVRGYAVMYGNYFTKNNVLMYNLRVRDSKWMKFYQKDKRGARFQLSQSNKPELVWCVSNELGSLITRRKGKVVILGNCPNCDVVIMARQTASLCKYMQMVGRALRYVPGKVALIIDHVSNVKRHKLPDIYRQWSLARRDKRAKKEPDPNDIPLTVCKSCARPYERVYAICPHCGAVPPLPNPQERTVEVVDGDLLLLDRAMLEQMRRATELEAPADIGERVRGAAGKIAAKAIIDKQIEKIEAQRKLADEIAQWAAIQREMGRSDSESYRRFYLATGTDVLSMLNADRTRQEYEESAAMIRGWYVGK